MSRDHGDLNRFQIALDFGVQKLLIFHQIDISWRSFIIPYLGDGKWRGIIIFIYPIDEY
jgi:hypothetical protein